MLLPLASDLRRALSGFSNLRIKILLLFQFLTFHELSLAICFHLLPESICTLLRAVIKIDPLLELGKLGNIFGSPGKRLVHLRIEVNNATRALGGWKPSFLVSLLVQNHLRFFGHPQRVYCPEHVALVQIITGFQQQRMSLPATLREKIRFQFRMEIVKQSLAWKTV